MGLDWKTLSKAKQGYDKEHKKIYTKLIQNTLTEQERNIFFEKLSTIEIDAYQTIGVPQCGIDKEATEYVTNDYLENKDLFDYPTLEDFLNAHKGTYLISLLKYNTDWGFPRYQGPFNQNRSDIFRAQFLIDDCYDLLPKHVQTLLYKPLFSEDLNKLGISLKKIAFAYGKKNKLYGMHKFSFKLPKVNVHIPKTEMKTPESNFHIIYSAYKWCEFWSDKGHGMAPDY